MQIFKLSRLGLIAAAAGIVSVAIVARSTRIAAAQETAAPCPVRPVPDASSSQPPLDTCIPNGFSEVAIDYFDDYSWRLFVGMMWPAATGTRGVADASRTLDDPGPRVFETYKSLWEVFHEDGTAPTDNFNDYDTAAHNACKVTPGFGDVILASSTPYGDIGQSGSGVLTGPLVAQNGRYVRYQTLYNQPAYDFIVRNKYFLRSNLPPAPEPGASVPGMQFPNGSLAIKAAWVDMTGFPATQTQRYYTRMAILKDPNSGTCSSVRVGLVGIHVVQKTPSRPQWSWSTYEHVDNVPPGQPDGPGKFLFHDGGTAAMPEQNPLRLIPLAPQPATPFNVVRSSRTPIHPNTAAMNKRYQALLKDSVWGRYQLVMTQWSRVPGNQANPVALSVTGDASTTFPGVGAGSAFANVTLETFDQERVQLGCMNCHTKARMRADFMWSVLDHAYPAVIAPETSAVRQTTEAPGR
jgi:hypothetical protein